MRTIRGRAAWAAAVAVSLAACGGGGAAGDTTAPPGRPALGPAALAGQVSYEINCAVCHGGELGGGVGPALAAGSPAAAKPIEDLEAVIRGGGNGMPAWEKLLPAEEIDGLVAFLSEVQGR